MSDVVFGDPEVAEVAKKIAICEGPLGGVSRIEPDFGTVLHGCAKTHKAAPIVPTIGEGCGLELVEPTLSAVSITVKLGHFHVRHVWSWGCLLIDQTLCDVSLVLECLSQLF